MTYSNEIRSRKAFKCFFFPKIRFFEKVAADPGEAVFKGRTEPGMKKHLNQYPHTWKNYTFPRALARSEKKIVKKNLNHFQFSLFCPVSAVFDLIRKNGIIKNIYKTACSCDAKQC